MGKDIDFSLSLEEHIKRSKTNRGGNKGGNNNSFNKGGKRQPLVKRKIHKGGNNYKQNGDNSNFNRNNNNSRFSDRNSQRQSNAPRNNQVIRRTGGSIQTSSRSANKNYKRLIVSNLPIEATNEHINELFGKFGPLNVCKIKYDKLGKSFGIATVEFKNEDHAKKALQKYNGAKFDNEIIKIKYDTPPGNPNANRGPRVIISTNPKASPS